ncbi:ParA family protein [Francisella noatunensis]|uniref:ParA family protein n=1 Tax=Francisella noatunensis TaxID=657445 RepID=A0A9Q2KR62_9GAMM|nr:ParA family protein [Francisella noatunensis]MBK2028423.1 ParA family protein [Francisella noatunensis]MBK2034093.1 ParA family protein [Francisella noatunensis]MBK2048885.1 ParA family protein [Francisella noatunensis]MBK2050790.1 ParA family protein [Francisella noatunensis]MBK2052290.1 ParA family protein [Francisella noatunensis]
MNNPKMSVASIANKQSVTSQAIHKKLKSNDIVLEKLGNKSYIDHITAKSFFNFSFKNKVIAFQIVKGGTGKTTSLFNVCCAASLYGAKILMVDLDPQGNLTDVCNVDAENLPVMIDIVEDNIPVREAIVNVYPGVDLISSRIENVVLDNKLALSKKPLDKLYKRIFKDIKNEYDFIFMDCPPTMGHSVSAVTLYADLLVIPLNPDKFSAKGLSILKNEIENLNNMYDVDIDYKVFLNKYSGNTILSDKAIQTTITKEHEVGKALSTAIKLAQEIPNAIDNEENIFSNFKQSSVRDDYDALAREILDIKI